jgi:hypothetical protein
MEPQVEFEVWHCAGLDDIGDTYLCHSLIGGNVESFIVPKCAAAGCSCIKAGALATPSPVLVLIQVVDCHRELFGCPPSGVSTLLARFLPVASSKFMSGVFPLFYHSL